MLTWLRDRLLERARATPYFHLEHADGSPYMRRYWLMPRRMLEENPVDQGFGLRADLRHLPAARLHHIVTADLDRELHNHPWSFVSIVLTGGYVEARPVADRPTWTPSGEELCTFTLRTPGSIAFRSYRDRHRIVYVRPDTWTLILQGPKRQAWGFFTQHGFVHWRDFESAHNMEPRP